MSKKRTSILYVTFRRDLEFMEYSLASITKFAKDFSEVYVLVPYTDHDMFHSMSRKFASSELPILVQGFMEFPGRGFMHHLTLKCYGDVLCPHSDYILHMDPDCMFREPVTPDDYIIDGKPVMLVELYDAIRKHEDPNNPTGRRNWQEGAERALGFPCPYETMCRHPSVYHRAHYKPMREQVEKVHRIPFHDYVIPQKQSFQQGFSEFDTLGAFCLEKFRDQYHVIDRGYTCNEKDPHGKLVQFWSHGGVGPNLNEINSILK